MVNLKKMIKLFFVRLPNKYILLESVPDLSDNTKAVFDEMLCRGLNRKYKFVWLCNGDVRNYSRIKNVIYQSCDSSRLSQCRCSYYYIRAKMAISCNRTIIPTNPNALAYYLHHGTPIKNTATYWELPKEINYILSPSSVAGALVKKQFGVSDEKVFALGYPRNDAFVLQPVDLKPFFPERAFRKVIAWYPTFRQKQDGRKTGSKYALPIIWNKERAVALNKYARDKEVLIVLKPHFAQDVKYIEDQNLSNIVIISDAFLSKNALPSYRFVGSCDALLTDYSSIYFDYTLCNKPIGLIWEDYEEYEKNPGFLVDMDEAMKGGEKLYTLEDMKLFVCEVSKGEDRLKEERCKVRDLYNLSTDGKNSQRVVEFLIEKSGLT